MDNLMGQDLEDLDQNNADLKRDEHVIDGLFAGQNDSSPDGIDQADISDIQKIINKSIEDSPDMGFGMDFNDVAQEEQEFYNNLKRVTDGGAVGAAFEEGEDYVDDYYDNDQNFDELEPDEMMRRINN